MISLMGTRQAARNGYKDYFGFNQRADAALELTLSRISAAMVDDGRFSTAEIERAEHALSVSAMESNRGDVNE